MQADTDDTKIDESMTVDHTDIFAECRDNIPIEFHLLDSTVEFCSIDIVANVGIESYQIFASIDESILVV